MRITTEQVLGRGGGPPILAAFFRGDNFLAVGDGAGNVVLWDTATGSVARRWSIYTRAVRALAFGGDGVSMVAASSDGTVRFSRSWPMGPFHSLPVGRVWSLTAWDDCLFLGGDGGQ